jgi:CO/xanthine dehydrogenase Mo-binding subunit/aerobic-type carbon monoxide dehydrogenase small subunit (CoxS/CutS family)
MLTVRVNGAAHAVNVHPLKRLSDVLRDDLRLTGTKIGCNAGDCGACTVRIDGAQACACLVPVGQVLQSSVETVESLVHDPLGARLQAAFCTYGATQCGICTPGMLMAAHDLLSRVPSPTRVQIADALAGVLCRCTGYQKIFEAIENCAVGTHASVVSVLGHIGERLAKVDGLAKVNGSERFGADAIPSNARWLRIIRSPHHRAAFQFGDLRLFAQKAGLMCVLTAHDVPRNGYGIYPTIKDQPVFADGETKFKGEAICALVGERARVEAIDVEDVPVVWEVMPHLHGIEAAERAQACVHLDTPSNVLIDGCVRKGTPHALADPAAQVSLRVTTGFVEHAYVEPEAGWAQRAGDRLHLHVTTQTPYMDRDEIASVMKLAPDAVRVVPTACGGGFGGKLDLSVHPYIALAAWLLPDRPVACVYDRAQSMASTTKRHPADIALTMSADANGKLQRCVSHAKFDTGAYASWGPTVATRVPIHATGPYFVPHVETRGTAYYTHCHPSGAFRGFGVPQAAIAHEAAMDALADQLQMDRLAFRLRNALGVGDVTATGQVLKDSAGLCACLLAVQPRWYEWRNSVRSFNLSHQTRKRGVGIGCMWYGIGNTSLSNPSTIRITLDRNGITLYSGAADIGQGSNTILSQIAAHGLNLPTAQLRLVAGDTDRTPDAGKTSASRQTYVSGRATELAAKNLRARILERVGLRDLEGTRLRVLSQANTTSVLVTQDRTSRELRLAYNEALHGTGTFDPPTTPQDADGQGEPYACYAFAAQVALVEVDLDLGTTQVLNVCAAHDVGRAINPTQVEGQVHGGILQGLGLALMENYLPGKTENLHDYLVPTIGDAPQMEVRLIEEPTALGPAGAKGVGEPGLVPTAPAILGAIEHATGVRMLDIPVLPHKLRAALVARTREP